MSIISLSIKINLDKNTRLTKAYTKMQDLIIALNKKEIPAENTSQINDVIQDINSFLGTERETRRLLRKSYSKLLTLLEKDLKIVSKNHYRNFWLAIGMAFGVAFSVSLDSTMNQSMGMLLGMVLGIAYGTTQDKKAEKDGLQLDVN